MEPSSLFSALSGIGVLFAGIGFAYAQFRSGASKAQSELVTTLREQLEIEKAKNAELSEKNNTLVKSHQEQLNSLNKEIGKLQGLHEANEKKIKEYMAILQDRNPETVGVLRANTEVLQQVLTLIKNK